MPQRFYELAFTPGVKAEQEKHGSARQYERMEHNDGFQNEIGPNERAFLAARDSFYMASVTETGWPYVQHRGGPVGFLHVLGHVEIHEQDGESDRLIQQLRSGDQKDVIERAVLIRVEGFDWNCPQHITPRFTASEIESAIAPLHRRIAELEAIVGKP